MKMSKVGNQTNSQDPQAVNSRVFVGNLNTFQCSKTDVERMFQRYGRLAGISMHKGYAFVQFTNPFDARSACLGEDGRTVLSQILDGEHGESRRDGTATRALPEYSETLLLIKVVGFGTS
ncbi:RNA-binding protein Raly-like [Photinus pyralis]|uniref:RNA-binding protein Raly-like n=1 Tax=Photinus pyralis TaxID=7054 RepID=UPI001267597D|nr:RNA-binding protein Raly-like [Photinus pyralis]